MSSQTITKQTLSSITNQYQSDRDMMNSEMRMLIADDKELKETRIERIAQNIDP